MKLTTLLFCLNPLFIFAQLTDYGNFKIVETEIIYQKVSSQQSITPEKLAEFLKTVPELKSVSVAGESITADMADLIVDYKKFMFSQVGTPPIIQTGKYSGKVLVEIKDGRYRVTISSITMTGDIGYKKIPQPEPMTNYACTNSGTILARDWCRPNMLGLLDQAITDKFNYKEEKKDSDW